MIIELLNRLKKNFFDKLFYVEDPQIQIMIVTLNRPVEEYLTIIIALAIIICVLSYLYGAEIVLPIAASAIVFIISFIIALIALIQKFDVIVGPVSLILWFYGIHNLANGVDNSKKPPKDEESEEEDESEKDEESEEDEKSKKEGKP